MLVLQPRRDVLGLCLEPQPDLGAIAGVAVEGVLRGDALAGPLADQRRVVLTPAGSIQIPTIR